MSVYIHIPFCSHICSYCDFPKVLKNNIWIKKYLKALEKEIKLNYKGEEINTLYIGGGTPSSLELSDLKVLFNIFKIFNFSKDVEITFEANSEDLTEEKLLFLSRKINRLSIGVETFNNNRLKDLNRELCVDNIKKASKYFKNINLDLMYGFDRQTIDDLKNDLDEILKLNPSHISTYSLIIEKNTKFYIDGYRSIDEGLDRKMYDLIIDTLKKNNYIHYEVSNFSKKGFESRHNLVYWNNDNYYGFGLGASGYINKCRYENTRSLNDYFKGNYLLESHDLDISEEIQNELILGFRKIEGINKNKFKDRYGFNLKDIDCVDDLLEKKLLLEDDNNMFINPKYMYISNEILINFIDYVYTNNGL